MKEAKEEEKKKKRFRELEEEEKGKIRKSTAVKDGKIGKSGERPTSGRKTGMNGANEKLGIPIESNDPNP